MNDVSSLSKWSFGPSPGEEPIKPVRLGPSKWVMGMVGTKEGTWTYFADGLKRYRVPTAVLRDMAENEFVVAEACG